MNPIARRRNFVLISLSLFLVLMIFMYKRSQDCFVVSVIHINDFHDRFDEITLTTNPCKPKDSYCIGGYSRTYARITELRSLLPNPIVLNAGDNFLGTLWFKTFGVNVTQRFINLLNFDAITLGNHDFDFGLEEVIKFMQSVDAPFVLTNVDDSQEPDFARLIQKSVILTRDNKRIGILGIALKTFMNMTRMGKLQLLDEISTVKKEAARLHHEEDCHVVIVLSHCGKEMDEMIAAHGGPYVDVIVGGHSHDLFLNGETIGPEKVAAPYPQVVTQESNRKVLIVQSFFASKYVGHLTVDYNFKHNARVWVGNSDLMGLDQLKDEKINGLLREWKNLVNDLAYTVIGTTKKTLDYSDCRYGECNIGNFFADALVDGWKDHLDDDQIPFATISLVSAGGIRATIKAGDILFMDLIGAMPFDDRAIAFEIRGDHLLETLETAATSKSNLTFWAPDLIQVSGIHYKIYTPNPRQHQIQNVKIKCRTCTNDTTFQPLNLTETYRVIVPEFLLDPVNGFKSLVNNLSNRQEGISVISVLRNYLKQYSPINFKKTGRVLVFRGIHATLGPNAFFI